MTENKPPNSFGQELLTQELVTFERVHVNVSQDLIIVNEDRMHLWLGDILHRSRKQKEWVAPLSLVLAVTLTLTTTSFKDFFIPSSTWHAIFLIVDILSFCWLIASLRHLRKPLVLAEEIARLKTYAPASVSRKELQEGEAKK